MKFETDELRKRYSLVVEGQCPFGHGELEHRDDGYARMGWCAECDKGWSVRGQEVTVYWPGFGRTCFATGDALDIALGDES